jgi:nitrilase
MKIAIAQTIAHSDLEKNFIAIEKFSHQAKQEGAELVIFPEMAYFSGKKSDWIPIAQNYEAILNRFSQLAKSLKIGLVPGTLREPTEIPEKFYNTLPFIDKTGAVIALYQKLFLYKAVLPDKTYDETQYSKAGNVPACIHWNGVTIGLAICFDLRFPELFRWFKAKGAQVVLLPSAFTVPTGQAHWEVLIRARAIENQLFFLAPGLTGTSGDGTAKYGHSLAVSPWGEIRANLETAEQVRTIEIDTHEIADAESKVPAWNCRREELFKLF